MGHTSNMHPREIFISNILKPMSLNTEDKAKTTPISVFDANKGKDTANTHFLICTFSSRQAISLIKKNAKKIPKPVRFCPKVPLQYTATLNEFLKTQGQIRLLRDKDGISLAKTKITTNEGHLVLENSDRVGDSFSPFYPIESFIPQTAESVPSTTPTPHQKTHTLIQCRLDDPVNSTSKDSIKAHTWKEPTSNLQPSTTPPTSSISPPRLTSTTKPNLILNLSFNLNHNLILNLNLNLNLKLPLNL